MQITQVFDTNYAANVVTCKLWGLTGSPTESILTLALSVNEVGFVDLAVIVPGLNNLRPIVVAECDGHYFHERTPEQASKDRRRMRNLQRLGILVLPFTGTDVVRASEVITQEIVESVHTRINGIERRWFQDRGINPDDVGNDLNLPRHILGRELGSILPFERSRTTPCRRGRTRVGGSGATPLPGGRFHRSWPLAAACLCRL
jgi:hypothetical protein